jgi:RNA polymerase sigma-70 factor (ECF subfamily)
MNQIVQAGHMTKRAAGAEDEEASAGAEPALSVLCRRLADADREAFEQLFRRLSRPVFRYVRGMTRSDATAHDITQDVFAKLWSVRETLATVDTPRAYIFRMARNRVYNHRRDEQTRRDREAQVEHADLEVTLDAPDAAVDTEMLRRLVERWIDDLPERQREALMLRRIQNLSHDAIADVMDISPHTVNTHLGRAMERLRDRLRQHRPDLLP